MGQGRKEKRGREETGTGCHANQCCVSLATQVNISWLNWIISSKGKGYRESGGNSRFAESFKWGKRKSLCRLHGN